jgi:hypothetical protein
MRKNGCADAQSFFWPERLSQAMKSGELVQCGKDASHESFDLRGKRCRECGCGLLKKCSDCATFVSYSNVAKHLKKCVKSSSEGQEEEGPCFRVGYLAAEWDVSVGTSPSGQYCAAPCKGFPEHFRKLVLNDPTEAEGDSVIVDAYDAIWGTLFATSKRWKLAHTFRSIKEVLKEEEWPELDVLGNWAYPTAFQDETTGKALALDMYHKLQELELDQHLRIFPPLDYAWYFSQKVHYYNKLSMMMPLPEGVFVIPTVRVVDGCVIVCFSPLIDPCADGALLEEEAPGLCQGTRSDRVDAET